MGGQIVGDDDDETCLVLKNRNCTLIIINIHNYVPMDIQCAHTFNLVLPLPLMSPCKCVEQVLASCLSGHLDSCVRSLSQWCGRRMCHLLPFVDVSWKLKVPHLAKFNKEKKMFIKYDESLQYNGIFIPTKRSLRAFNKINQLSLWTTIK